MIIAIPQERIPERTFQAVEKDIVNILQTMFCTEKRIVDMPFPWSQKDIVEVTTDIAKERISELMFEPIKEEIADIVQNMDVCTGEKIMDMPVSQLQDVTILSAFSSVTNRGRRKP